MCIYIYIERERDPTDFLVCLHVVNELFGLFDLGSSFDPNWSNTDQLGFHIYIYYLLM